MKKRRKMVRRPAARSGLSLAEVLITTVIMGIGMVALMAAIQSGTKIKADESLRTQAVLLAQELREWTVSLPFTDPDSEDQGNPPGPDGISPQVFVDDLDDLMEVTFTVPRDSAGTPLTDRLNWSETITITWRSSSDVNQTVDPGDSDVVYVKVQLAYKDENVFTTGWLVTETQE